MANKPQGIRFQDMLFPAYLTNLKRCSVRGTLENARGVVHQAATAPKLIRRNMEELGYRLIGIVMASLCFILGIAMICMTWSSSK